MIIEDGIYFYMKLMPPLQDDTRRGGALGKRVWEGKGRGVGVEGRKEACAAERVAGNPVRVN